MSSPAVRLLASRLANQPGVPPRPPGVPIVGRGGYGGGNFGAPKPVVGGGWNDPLAKEPGFQSPGLGTGKYPPKGRPITTRPGGGMSNQPYRF